MVDPVHHHINRSSLWKPLHFLHNNIIRRGRRWSIPSIIISIDLPSGSPYIFLHNNIIRRGRRWSIPPPPTEWCHIISLHQAHSPWGRRENSFGSGKLFLQQRLLSERSEFSLCRNNSAGEALKFPVPKEEWAWCRIYNDLYTFMKFSELSRYFSLFFL